MKILSILVVLAALLVGQTVRAEAPPSFLKDGDIWVCTGDSITNADTYRRTLQRVIQHFHPDASIRVVNSGKYGAMVSAAAEEFEKASKNERPTIVSVMSAMNHSINSGWHRGEPMDPYIDGYIKGLDDLVKGAKAKGITVIVMSPTLTDEAVDYGSNWELAGTRAFLEVCTQRTKQLAEREGAIYLPVSEELEAAQITRLPEQVLRPDGVHPSSFGEYQIASTFFRHLDLAGPLSGLRSVKPVPTADLPVSMKLASRFIVTGERKLTFNLESASPITVTATWSCRNVHRSEELKLTGKDTWTIELPDAAAKLKPGEADDVVIDLTDGVRRSIYIVDLCSTRVAHFKDDKVSGELRSRESRPEGKIAAKWSLTRQGKGLFFDAEVFDSEIRDDFDWPWGRDNMTLWLDYRPTDRFADVGVDCDVHQILLNVSEKPAFAVSLLPWLGRGMNRAASVSGEKTPSGHKVRMYIHNNFNKTMDSDLSTRDFIGFNVANCDLDTGADGKQKLAFTWLQETQYAPDQYANSMVILDLKDKLKGDAITNVCLSRL